MSRARINGRLSSRARQAATGVIRNLLFLFNSFPTTPSLRMGLLSPPKGPGKRGHIVADTLLPMMFLGLRKLGNICVGNNVSATMCRQQCVLVCQGL